MAVVRQPGQRIFCGLLTQMILELALLGDVLDDDLVTAALPVVAHFASAEPNSERRAILSFPFNFQWIGSVLTILLRGVPQQLLSFGGIAKNLAHMIRRQEFVLRCVTEHCHQRLIDIKEFAFATTATHPVSQVSYQRPITRFGMT